MMNSFMKKLICIAITLIFLIPVAASAGPLDNWEFRFFGINPRDLKGKDTAMVIVGGLSSFVVHEFGHWAFGKYVGIDSTFDASERAVIVNDDDWVNASEHDKLLFCSGGFIAQFVVGGLLTLNKGTRYTDFNYAFNVFTAINNGVYTATGGLKTDNNHSDIYNITKYGWDGELAGTLSSFTGALFVHYSLDKNKKK